MPSLFIKIASLIVYTCTLSGVQILPVSINQSIYVFTVTGNLIYLLLYILNCNMFIYVRLCRARNNPHPDKWVLMQDILKW